MKKIILILISVLAFVAIAPAQVTYSNLLLYTAVNDTTNNGGSAIIGTARVPMPVYSLQHGPLLDTNNILYRLQISFDGTNFISIATNRPTSTNEGAIDSIQPSVQRLQVYTRVQFVTTNNVSVGGAITLGSGLQ